MFLTLYMKCIYVNMGLHMYVCMQVYIFINISYMNVTSIRKRSVIHVTNTHL